MSVKREDVLKYLEEANMIEISELVKDIEDKIRELQKAQDDFKKMTEESSGGDGDCKAVSYTHLTLPTN